MNKLKETVLLKFHQNVGTADRILRITGALATGVFIYLGSYGVALTIGISVLSFAILMTGFTGKCSIYNALGYNTKSNPTV